MNKRRHTIYFYILAFSVPLVRVQFAGTQPKFNILVSNDDGVDAQGIAALAEAMTRLERMTVAAPSQDNSGMGHEITWDPPIFVREAEKI